LKGLEMSTTTHIDFAWQTKESTEEVAHALEASLSQALPHVGGMLPDTEWESRYSHQKMRVTMIVEILEEFA
jgi:hypothetical protein